MSNNDFSREGLAEIRRKIEAYEYNLNRHNCNNYKVTDLRLYKKTQQIVCNLTVIDGDTVTKYNNCKYPMALIDAVKL